MWVKKNWNDLKKGFRENVSIFTEDAESGEYQVKSASVEFITDTKIASIDCKKITVSFDNRKSEWCLDQHGGLVEMTVKDAQITVTRASNENAAKAHLQTK
jgi:hypothetical protein